MAGSVRNFAYETDAGDSFVLRADESNVEAINGTNANVPPIGERPIYYLPRSFKPRRARYATPDGLRTLIIPVLTSASYATVQTNFPTVVSNGFTYEFLTKDSEKIRGIRWSDSGLTDGDSETAA